MVITVAVVTILLVMLGGLVGGIGLLGGVKREDGHRSIFSNLIDWMF
jgi:hypothetical protein